MLGQGMDLSRCCSSKAKPYTVQARLLHSLHLSIKRVSQVPLKACAVSSPHLLDRCGVAESIDRALAALDPQKLVCDDAPEVGLRALRQLLLQLQRD